jgi:hypothetical protein
MEKEVIAVRNAAAKAKLNLEVGEIIAHKDSPEIRRWRVNKTRAKSVQLKTIGAGVPSYFDHLYSRMQQLIEEGSLFRTGEYI